MASAVHVLGCHLQADGWEHMVWGSGDQLGRAPRAVQFAWNANVSHISWGTGASEKDGKKESRYTFDLACSRFLELARLCGADDSADPYENTFLLWLKKVSVIDDTTQNTTEEIKAAADLCLSKKVHQLTLVTSPFHMPRAAKEADNVIRGDLKYAPLLGKVLLLPSMTSLPDIKPNDEVTIFERPHRGDTWKPPEDLMLHKIARRTFGLFKDTKKLEAYLGDWKKLLGAYVDDKPLPSANLENVETEKLVSELLTRDLVRPDGLLEPTIWPLRVKLGAISCVDGVPTYRREDGVIVGGVIRRKTGKFPNKLACVGGVVALYENIESALRRHFKQDLGLEINFPLGWDHPVCMRQYAPQVNGENRPGFCHDPGKHSYASTHLVQIVGDSSQVTFGEKIGGQEASALEWYTAESCPPEDDWSYDMRDTFLHVLEEAKRLI